jgi:hypothetical protein
MAKNGTQQDIPYCIKNIDTQEKGEYKAVALFYHIDGLLFLVLTTRCLQPPTVHPINLVVEGSSMTILCIAMGTPMPTISLYISGRLVRQEVTRHMVTVIYNVTRDMDHISCYADNGYGTPMERRRRITISRKYNQWRSQGVGFRGLNPPP